MIVIIKYFVGYQQNNEYCDFINICWITVFMDYVVDLMFWIIEVQFLIIKHVVLIIDH